MIYVASSWRNRHQPSVVNHLRGAGYKVYDFREPAPGERGFNWSEIDPDWQSWGVEQFIGALIHPIAVRGFERDHYALESCSACVLVLPCGRSAHLEAGYTIGRGKPTAIYWPSPDEKTEPELMYLLGTEAVVGPFNLISWAIRQRLTRLND